MPPKIPLTKNTLTQRPTTRPSILSTSISNPSKSQRAPTTTRTFTTSTPLSARLIRRPHRPYTFTQLIVLSDGSTFTHRTTSPLAVYKSNKDVRNTPLWNPSNAKMASIEEDEAGRLRAFRRRFGRGFESTAIDEGAKKGEEEKDADAVAERVKAASGTASTIEGEESRGAKRDKSQREIDEQEQEEEEDNLMDLIGKFGLDAPVLKEIVRPKGKSGKK